MNQEPTQPKKSNNIAVIIIIIVAVLAALGVAGYFFSRWMAKKAVESLTGGKVTTASDDSASLNLGDTSVKTGLLASWPTDLPIELTAPEDVTIKSASKMTSVQTWIVNIGDIPTNAIDNYIDDLASNKGWTKASDDNVLIRIIILTKDNWKLAISYDESSRGAQLTISPK